MENKQRKPQNFLLKPNKSSIPSKKHNKNIVKSHTQIDTYNKSGVYQMKYIGRWAESFTLDTKNTYRQSGIIMATRDIRVIY